jgi:deferrochelatase/peroxidase EfeB
LSDTSPGVSRRRLLGGAGLVGTGVLLGAGGAYGADRVTAGDDASTGDSADAVVEFYGTRQAGITTPQQSRLVFAAFDLTTSEVNDVKAMLGQWAAAASLMTKGELIGPTEIRPQSPPFDTGEALGIGAQRLTVTVGFGPSMFDHRFGLADKRPAALEPLPDLPGDAVIDRQISGGDVCVQACADDPQVAFHVIRNFARIAAGTAALRWSQVGFGRASVTSRTQQTPRNLMGFKDGTRNIKVEDATATEDFVWVGDETDQEWMRDGSYLVMRKIRMQIEAWDSDSLADQEHVIGRTKQVGAPLSGSHEHDPLRLGKRGADGSPLVPADSHVSLASPERNHGIQILRRGYNYADGIDPTTGQIDAGLFFLAYQKNAHEQFVPIQRRLGAHDLLNEYIKHVSTGLYACPGGVEKVGDWFGRRLFGS